MRSDSTKQPSDESRCRYCGSDHLTEIAWRDLLAERLQPESRLIFDGAQPIARTLTFCALCGSWLPSSSGRRQTEELIAALRLVTVVPEFADARIEHSDRPDVRVHLANRQYGLEVTRIARGGQKEIQRAQWQKAVERMARLSMRDRGNPPVWVSVLWRPDPPRVEVPTAVRILVEFAEQQLAAVGNVNDRFMRHLHGHDLPDDVAVYLTSLTLARARNGTDDNWASGFSGYPDVQPEELQNEIDKKADKVGGYASPGDGLWLLIYGESSNAAQALDVTEDAMTAPYSGPFDRVFFLDCMDKAAELQLVARLQTS